MKKLIVEIDDKYADVVTMSFIGTTDTIPTTVATVILKPDVDNLCKALFDIMTRLHYWGDDKQIYSAVVEKYWAEVPGVFVQITEAEK